MCPCTISHDGSWGCSEDSAKKTETPVKQSNPHRQKEMIGLWINAGKIMDGLFWHQAFGDKEALLAEIENPKAKKFTQINYGSWNRLDANKLLIDGYDAKNKGAENSI